MHALVLHLSFGGGSNATAAEQATTTIGRGRLSLFCASAGRAAEAEQDQDRGSGQIDQAAPQIKQSLQLRVVLCSLYGCCLQMTH